MRIWTIHPSYLDRQGLVALWREALLAQAVLRGKTKGYRHHPQLERFKKQPDPIGAVASYLVAVVDESVRRGYQFNKQKICKKRSKAQITETRGQLIYEWRHFLSKLELRSPSLFLQYKDVKHPQAHPLFRVVSGGIGDWEKMK